MGVNRGPSPIVTDGIVFSVDCRNPQSYPGTGTEWNNIINPANNGTIGADVSFSTPNMYFSGGTDNNVSFPMATNNLIQTPMTIEFWLNRKSGGDAHNVAISTRNVATAGNGIILFLQTISPTLHYFKIYAGGDGGFLYYAGNDFPEDIWMHIVVSIDSSFPDGAKLYKNNTLLSWTGDTGTGALASSTTDPLIMGSSPNEAYDFDGYIDIVNIYNRALSQAEITQNYNSQKARFGL
jgi:hypothetical protein